MSHVHHVFVNQTLLLAYFDFYSLVPSLHLSLAVSYSMLALDRLSLRNTHIMDSLNYSLACSFCCSEHCRVLIVIQTISSVFWTVVRLLLSLFFSWV